MDPRVENAPTHDFNEFLHHLRTIELRGLPAGADTVLSGGCSGAWYFDWFAENYPSPVTRHIGVEAYSPRPESLPDGVEWIDSTLGDMGAVADGSVDLVFAGQVFEHMWADEVVGFLSECHRVLRPGGTLCIDSPNRTVTMGTGWHQPEHTVEFTVAEATDLLRLAGFSDVDVTGIWLGHDRATGRYIPVDVDGGGAEWPWQRRVLEATTQPEHAFIWWAVATKGDGTPMAAPLRDHVHAIFARSRPLYFARLHSNAGTLSERGQLCVAAGVEGFVLYGPYVAMPPGHGSATFRIERPAGQPVGRPTDVIARVDAVATGERTISLMTVQSEAVEPGAGPVSITLDFDLPQTTFGVEFRLWTSGRATLRVDPRVDVQEGSVAAAAGPDAEQGSRDQFLLEEYRRLRAFRERVTGSLPWRLSGPLRAARRRRRGG